MALDILGTTPTEFKDILNNVNSGYNNAIKTETLNTDITIFEQGNSFGRLKRIGKPCGFHNIIDPGHRVGKYLRNKMMCIDILPCTFSLSMSNVTTSNGVPGFLPKIDYAPAMTDYILQQSMYHVPADAVGLRIYTTDETMSSDSFTNTFQPNSFEGMLNNLMSKGQELKDAMYSIGAKQQIDNLANNASNLASSGASGLASAAGANNKTSQDIGKLAGDIASSIITGRRFSLPEIWQGSNYAPNLTVTTKFVSPYGHPKAIKKFVIEPLIYLLLLSGAQTEDGVTFGRPTPITINAYGLAHASLGGISNITLRRGGSDTSFNMYSQPLSIDVTIDFKFLYSGFAAYKMGQNIGTLPSRENTYLDADKELTSARGSLDLGLPTLGQVIRSLRPCPPEKFSADKLYDSLSNINTVSDTSIRSSALSTPGLISYRQDTVDTVKTNINNWMSGKIFKDQYDNLKSQITDKIKTTESRIFNETKDSLLKSNITTNPFK